MTKLGEGSATSRGMREIPVSLLGLDSSSSKSLCYPLGQEPAFVPLAGGVYWAAIDVADAELVVRYKWRAKVSDSGNVYAKRTHWCGGRPYEQYMHTLITGYTNCDHENGIGLDNRRANLRQATNSGQGANAPKRRDGLTSRFKGVSRKGEKWQATIRKNGRKRWIGVFGSEEDAARAYDQAALELHGKFAKTNKMLGLLS